MATVRAGSSSPCPHAVQLWTGPPAGHTGGAGASAASLSPPGLEQGVNRTVEVFRRCVSLSLLSPLFFSLSLCHFSLSSYARFWKKKQKQKQTQSHVVNFQGLC